MCRKLQMTFSIYSTFQTKWFENNIRNNRRYLFQSQLVQSTLISAYSDYMTEWDWEGLYTSHSLALVFALWATLLLCVSDRSQEGFQLGVCIVSPWGEWFSTLTQSAWAMAGLAFVAVSLWDRPSVWREGKGVFGRRGWSCVEPTGHTDQGHKESLSKTLPTVGDSAQ